MLGGGNMSLVNNNERKSWIQLFTLLVIVAAIVVAILTYKHVSFSICGLTEAQKAVHFTICPADGGKCTRI